MVWSQMMSVERIRRRRIDAMSIRFQFDLARVTEKAPIGCNTWKAGKVDVATIHDVDGSGFRQEHIEGMNVSGRAALAMARDVG